MKNYKVYARWKPACREIESVTHFVDYDLAWVIYLLKARCYSNVMLRETEFDIFDDESNLVAYKKRGRIRFSHRRIA